tara:strand:+ start:3113 stop:4342 length:1230 start_codon:yes stop_codon:yes gene_type:complete
MALLGLTNGDLQKEVNEYLFGGTGVPAAASDAEDVVNRVIASGLRQFYSPPPVSGYVHDWSFLKPVTNSKLEAPYTNGNTNTGSFDESNNTVTIDKLGCTVSDTDTETYTTVSDHGFSVGDVVIVADVAAGGNVTETILSIPAPNKFTVDEANVVNSGTTCYKQIPSWATSGFLDFDGVSYPVASASANTIVLDSNDNPGAALSSKTFKLHQDDYDLPRDFGRIVGNITFSEKDNAWHTVKIIGEARIRELRQRDYAASSSTDPILAAIVPKKTLATAATPDPDSGGVATHTIKFWPAITSSAVIHYRYEVRPQAFSAAGDYPYGADDHSDTILYSCLSEAERRLDREAGVYKMRFMEALTSSIEKDGRANRPEMLGYNSDQSDGFDPEHTRIYGGRIRHKQQDGTYLE